jgi:alpha-glucosidase
METNQPNLKDFPGSLRTFSQEANRFYFEAEKTRLEVTVISDHIARFRFTPDYFSRDFSYAIDPGLNLPETVASIAEDRNHYLVGTSALNIHISKQNLKIRIEDQSGKLICADENGYHWEPNQGFGGNYVYCSKAIQPNECFYGLGDKPDNLNLRGKRFLNWGTDTYGFAKEQDPLYRNIPFFYGLHDGMGYGIFFDNSFQTYFDFGHENPDVLSFWAEGGEMCYYFIAGPELMRVAERYALLTGRPELPPLWALGYHQSKWSYFPESRVMEIAAEFRKRKIPCDVIHLDIDYMDGYRCFTWDKTRFPDPEVMTAALRARGFETVVIIDPGIKIDPDYFVFREAIQYGYFCKRQDGDLMSGKVWPGDCHFPDFTNPVVREWWSGLMEPFAKQGIGGVWNDMNEPAVFEIGTFPDDVRHHYDGLDVSHRRGHNVYGMQMARSTYEGLKKHRPDKRPFVLSRSGFSGLQRFSAVWTGDNIASWEHLWIANMQCQRLSVSGISFCGTDIGGFIGQPDGELFVRYIQMAVFHPFFRGHSSNDHGEKEPWAFGENYEPLIRQAIELRYQLLPLIYTTFWQHVAFGTPMIRSLAFIAQDEGETLLRMHEFGFGDHLLVCPVKEAGATSRKMYLPKGHWYNYWSDKQIKGGHEINVPAPAGEIPVFVRAGAVIPHNPIIQHTGELVEEVILHVYFAMHRMNSYYYTDAGDGYAYRDGDYRLRKLTTFGNRRQFRIVCEQEGRFQEKIKRFRIVVHGLPFSPRICEVDGMRVHVSPRQKGKLPELEAPVGFRKITIRSQLQKE